MRVLEEQRSHALNLMCEVAWSMHYVGALHGYYLKAHTNKQTNKQTSKHTLLNNVMTELLPHVKTKLCYLMIPKQTKHAKTRDNEFELNQIIKDRGV